MLEMTCKLCFWSVGNVLLFSSESSDGNSYGNDVKLGLPFTRIDYDVFSAVDDVNLVCLKVI